MKFTYVQRIIYIYIPDNAKYWSNKAQDVGTALLRQRNKHAKRPLGSYVRLKKLNSCVLRKCFNLVTQLITIKMAYMVSI